jgi:hypothetical protein
MKKLYSESDFEIQKIHTSNSYVLNAPSVRNVFSGKVIEEP